MKARQPARLRGSPTPPRTRLLDLAHARKGDPPARAFARSPAASPRTRRHGAPERRAAVPRLAVRCDARAVARGAAAAGGGLGGAGAVAGIGGPGCRRCCRRGRLRAGGGRGAARGERRSSGEVGRAGGGSRAGNGVRSEAPRDAGGSDVFGSRGGGEPGDCAGRPPKFDGAAGSPYAGAAAGRGEGGGRP